MKRLRILTFLCLVLSALLLAASSLYQRHLKDDTIPVIQCPDTPLVLSVGTTDDTALLKGVTAWDDKDGDLTAQLMLQGISKRPGDSNATVTYAVADSDHHVVTQSRELQFRDYQLPHFALDKELVYSVGGALRVKDRLTASDCIDGDLTDRIRIVSSSTSSSTEGVFPVTFQVTNSLGDTSTITLDIVIHNYVAGEPRITLSDYLIYQKSGNTFNARDYLKSVTGGDMDNVVIDAPQHMAAGVNKVTYTCTGNTGAQGSATLYVVME